MVSSSPSQYAYFGTTRSTSTLRCLLRHYQEFGARLYTDQVQMRGMTLATLRPHSRWATDAAICGIPVRCSIGNP